MFYSIIIYSFGVSSYSCIESVLSFIESVLSFIESVLSFIESLLSFILLVTPPIHVLSPFKWLLSNLPPIQLKIGQLNLQEKNQILYFSNLELNLQEKIKYYIFKSRIKPPGKNQILYF